MFDFSNQVVLVAGAGGNLGSAVAAAYYQAGAKLVLGERHPKQLQAFYQGDPRVQVVAVDLLDPEQVEQYIYSAVERFGHIDVLANTVGGFRKSRLQETDPEQWDFVFNLNLKSAYLLSRAVILQMLEQGSGKIVHVSARAARNGSAGQAAYSASKSGLIRMVESLASEVKDNGITVNCVLPGTIDTPQNRQDMPKADHGKWVAPEAIADAILFLTSEAARAVTGAALPVYGRS
jgi:NAD(P)-dependent dehydrogenase (short-subunit alcohol dehydrogenase family)